VKLNGFDRIAFIYDFLAKLVFNNSIVNSQKYFLNKIQDYSKVLILGGGSGQLLVELLKLKPNCEVCYVEASERMIVLSKNKIKRTSMVHFIHGTEEDISRSIEYDALITNFYLDLFTEYQLADIIVKLQSAMKPEAQWIVTDFVSNNKWWQETMLKVMYWFFRITCDIESQQLPEWDKAVEKIGVKEIESKTFYRSFIKTSLYQF
jgi:ubiquinone/menaquinone biosynthesis C-methylase UbiE